MLSSFEVTGGAIRVLDDAGRQIVAMSGDGAHLGSGRVLPFGVGAEMSSRQAAHVDGGADASSAGEGLRCAVAQVMAGNMFILARDGLMLATIADYFSDDMAMLLYDGDPDRYDYFAISPDGDGSYAVFDSSQKEI